MVCLIQRRVLAAVPAHAGVIGTRCLTDADSWIGAMAALNPGFKMLVLQMGPPAMSFMQQMGAKPNCEFALK